ncbi:MAG: response regulator, partial [Friedmanniella sp.]
MRSRVLVVDDDAALAEMLSIVLRNEGYEPVWCAYGDKALAIFRESRPDLVLLDLMLPGRDGVDVCREIRQDSGVPIIMLTAKTDTIDIVEGLEAGADDYVSKPFKAKELVARIKTRLRRAPVAEETGTETLRIGDLEISVDGHSVKRGGVSIQLTPLEFDLLLALAR